MNGPLFNPGQGGFRGGGVGGTTEADEQTKNAIKSVSCIFFSLLRMLSLQVGRKATEMAGAKEEEEMGVEE